MHEEETTAAAARRQNEHGCQIRLPIIYDYLLLRLFEINHKWVGGKHETHSIIYTAQSKVYCRWKEKRLSLTEICFDRCWARPTRTTRTPVIVVIDIVVVSWTHMPISWALLSPRLLRNEQRLNRKYFVIKCNWAFCFVLPLSSFYSLPSQIRLWFIDVPMRFFYTTLISAFEAITTKNGSALFY